MFVKKLVEKASFVKKPGGTLDNLKVDDVDPHLVFHNGIPSGANLLSYDSIQKILAIATRDGRIKLFGKDGSQVLLESPEMVPSKFLQFLENQGILVAVNSNNHIEVWDLEKKCLSYVHDFRKEITCCTAIPHVPYVYVGDSVGNVSVLKLNREAPAIELMKYRIPVSEAHGNSGLVAANYVLPQPTAESKRVLIVYADGFIVLWAIQESKVIFTTGGATLQAISHETKKVTAASWACPFGSKLVVGYSNGEIFMWCIPSPTSSKIDEGTEKEAPAQTGPICKLNLGYKLEKIPIAKLRWVHTDGKASRLYAIGSSNNPSANLLQVVLLNDQTEARTIKLGLHPPESSIDMEIISSFTMESKQKHNSLLSLGNLGHVYAYDDHIIERYLLQCQSKSTPSLPKEIMVKLPFVDSNITVSTFMADNPYFLYSMDHDYDTLAKEILPLFPCDAVAKDGASSKSMHFRGFSKAKNLYITGHSTGAIKFWDISCPLMRPVLSINQQSEDDVSLSGVPLTALYCTADLQILVSGDQSGTIRFYRFKPENYVPETSFLSLQGVTKKNSNSAIQSIKLLKVHGAVCTINLGQNLNHLAVGSDQGNVRFFLPENFQISLLQGSAFAVSMYIQSKGVSLFDLEKSTLLYERHFTSDLSSGIICLQFKTCNFHGFDKNALVIACKDSSVTALELETGNTISDNPIRPKKPSRALFMHVLASTEGQNTSGGSTSSDKVEMIKANPESPSSKQQEIVLCSEKAVYVYSLPHILQGVKKVHHKKKFHSAVCCYASVLESPGYGLVLLFSSGKIEIRSLPELSLLKEISVRGLRPSIPNSKSFCSSSVCFSRNGDIILVEGDQEAFFISVLLRKEIYRFLDFTSQIYTKYFDIEQEPTAIVQKEKKKGIFGAVIKDLKGTKSKSEINVEVEDARESIEELSAIFSADNFPSEEEREEKFTTNQDDLELDIDDINIDDPDEKPKGFGVMAALNKHNFTDKLQAIKGKLITKKVKNDKIQTSEAPQDEKTETIDQIKKKYGYTTSSESSIAGAARTKLSENLKKLQGISMKTTEMQDTARSFSSMAKEVLRFAENDKRSSTS